MTNKDIIVIEANGVNEIEIGDGAKLSLVKAGESKRLSVNNKAPNEKMRWIWIAAKYLPIAKTFALGQTYPEWGEWKTKNAEAPIDVFGIGKQYLITDKSVSIKAQKAEALNKGVIFYAEAFREQPSLTHGHYIATIDEPKILSAYFARYKDEFKYPGEQGKSNVYTYKNSIRLYILGHMLPNYTVPYHNFALFEVDIYDDEGQKVTETPLQFFQKSNRSTFTVNTLTELNIPIDEVWRSKSKHKENTIKTYHAQIKTTLYSNEDAVTGAPLSKVESNRLITANPNPKNNNSVLKYTNKFNSVAPNNEDIVVTYTTEDEAVSKGGFWSLGSDSNRGKAHAKRYKTKIFREVFSTKDAEVLEGQQTTFQVKYNSMTVILDKYEASKTNMLTVIGDVEYSSKKVHPCKYSKLTISHKSRNTPFVLFDEDKKTKKVVDHTNLAFGIVAGETQETIKILAEGLNIQDYHPDHKNPPICHGITTARVRLKNFMLKDKPKRHTNQEDFKHNTIKDVFSMEKAYVLYPNSTFGILPKEFDKSVAGDESIDITKQAVDFEYLDSANEKGIALKVGYLYNKNYDNRVLNFLAHGTDGVLEGNDLYKSLQNLWVFTYLVDIIAGNKLYQSYFVPITTCRYPNQMAIIRVYPDIKWAINFNYNIEEPLYYDNSKGMLNFYDKAKAKGEQFPLFTDDPSGRIAKQKKGAEEKKKALDKVKKDKKHTTKFSLHFEVEAEGKNYVKLGSDFAEKTRAILSPIMKIYDLVDRVTGAKNARKAEREILDKAPRNTKGAGILKRIKRVPMTLELKPPGVGAGIAIGYDSSANSHIIGHELQGNVKLDPIIGGNLRIDLLALADKIPVYGKLVTALDLASWLVDWLSNGNVEVNYKIDLTFYANLTLPKTYVSYNFATHKLDWQGSVEGTFGGKLEMNVELSVKIEKYRKIPEFQFEAGVEADCYFKVTIDPRAEDNLKTEFSGLLVKVYYKLSLSSNRDKKKPKKKIDPIKLIPSLTKSTSIKFG